MTFHRSILGASFALLASAAAWSPCAQAFTFTMTPVTNTTSTFAGAIAINGVVSVGVGETFIHPTVMSTSAMPFKSNLSAGFNGPGQNWDAGFLAWNGVGTYTGAIFNHVIVAGNLGYAGGMPLGLYGTNPIGPSGGPGIVLWYIDANGVQTSAAANYAINVVPAPAAPALLGIVGCIAARRKRR